MRWLPSPPYDLLPANGVGDRESAKKVEFGGGQDARAPGRKRIDQHFQLHPQMHAPTNERLCAEAGAFRR